MNYDIPKAGVIVQNPTAEIRPLNKIVQAGKLNNDLETGPQPEAPDLGGYPVGAVPTTGTAGTAGTANASLTASGISANFYNPPYIIPRFGPILKVEVDLQIEAKNLQEAGELAKKG